jgi:hypothetical protein
VYGWPGQFYLYDANPGLTPPWPVGYYLPEAVAQVGAAGGVEAAFAPVVTGLRQVRQLLDRADRDYDGHRARARDEVGSAIAALPRQGGGADLAAVEGGERQAVSDTQLREAHRVLGSIHGQLAFLPLPAAAEADGHIRNAMREIASAVGIK